MDDDPVAQTLALPAERSSLVGRLWLGMPRCLCRERVVPTALMAVIKLRGRQQLGAGASRDKLD